jgi:hypothetical protein
MPQILSEITDLIKAFGAQGACAIATQRRQPSRHGDAETRASPVSSACRGRALARAYPHRGRACAREPETRSRRAPMPLMTASGVNGPRARS